MPDEPVRPYTSQGTTMSEDPIALLAEVDDVVSFVAAALTVPPAEEPEEGF